MTHLPVPRFETHRKPIGTDSPNTVPRAQTFGPVEAGPYALETPRPIDRVHERGICRSGASPEAEAG
ncbi:hypothetical protein EDC27_2377 [Desulfosoma caldarium]|uniref:Uncharacterized protein n=1 Tax=Desulfosoma caldarium TaxID=610254 RepID=A0A3N1UQX2_9BACT|nr:hypothetical protein EDC27_2377 [Desulfosoma caldarium]